jgi:hypothetical protein
MSTTVIAAVLIALLFFLGVCVFMTNSMNMAILPKASSL